MRSQVCEACGAALTVPADTSVATFVCTFCKREFRTADFESAEELAAKRLEAGLGKAIEDSGRAQRRTIVVGFAVVAALIGGTTIVLSTSRGADASSSPTPPAPPNVAAAAPTAVAPSPAPTPAPATPKAPSMAKLELTFGGEGTGPGKFDRAHNLAVDRDGSVYVVDRTNRVQKFDATGNLQKTFTVSTKNEPTGELSSDIGYAIGIAVNSKREILVSISYDVLVLEPKEGNVVRKFPGTPNVICYRELAIDQQDDVYAVIGCEDAHKHALVKIGHDGRILKRYKEPPSYEQATSEKLAVDGAGKIFAPHGSEREIQVLNSDWEIFTRFGRRGDGPGEFSFPPGPLVLDSTGRLFACEGGNVHVFDETGKVLGRFDTTDSGNAFDLAVGAHDELWALTGKQLVARYTVARN